MNKSSDVKTICVGKVYLHIYAIPYDTLVPYNMILEKTPNVGYFLRLEPVITPGIEATAAAEPYNLLMKQSISLSTILGCIRYKCDPNSGMSNAYVFFQSRPRLWTCSTYPTIYVPSEQGTGQIFPGFPTTKESMNDKIALILKIMPLIQGLEANDHSYTIFCKPALVGEIRENINPILGRPSFKENEVTSINDERFKGLLGMLFKYPYPLNEYINKRNLLLSMAQPTDNSPKEHKDLFFELEQIAKDTTRINFKSNVFFHISNPLSPFICKNPITGTMGTSNNNNNLLNLIDLFQPSEGLTPLKNSVISQVQQTCRNPFYRSLIQKMIEGGKISKSDPNPSKMVINYIGCTLVYLLVSNFVVSYKKPFVQGMCDYAQFAIETVVSKYINGLITPQLNSGDKIIKTFDERTLFIPETELKLDFPRIEFALNDIITSIDGNSALPLLVQLEFSAYQLMSGLILANQKYIFDNEFSVLEPFTKNACVLIKNFEELNKGQKLELPNCYGWFMLLGLREFRSIEDRFFILEKVYKYGVDDPQHTEMVMFLCLSILCIAVEYTRYDSTYFFNEVQYLVGILRGDIVADRMKKLIDDSGVKTGNIL